MQLSTNFGSAAQRLLHGRWYLTGLGSASWPTLYGVMTSTNDSGNVRYYTGAGRLDSTGADSAVITAFRFDALVGNINGGTFTLRGRRKQ